jgi:hypothetical protein
LNYLTRHAGHRWPHDMGNRQNRCERIVSAPDGEPVKLGLPSRNTW